MAIYEYLIVECSYHPVFNACAVTGFSMRMVHQSTGLMCVNFSCTIKRASLMNDYLKGLLITISGVLIITPDSLLIRLLNVDSWATMFWRNFLSGIVVMLALLLYYRSDFLRQLSSVGRSGMLMALVWAAGTFCFIYSVKTTLVANTLFIVSISPIFAALIAWLVLKEPVSKRTWLTIISTLIGIGIIAYGSLTPDGQGNLLGDLAALGTALAVAISFSIARRHKHISMIPAMGVSNLFAGLIALPFSASLALTTETVIPVAILGLFVAPVGAALLIIGPRYLPAADVSLLILLEAVIAPLWVWWMLNEFPGHYTLVGGALVLVALVVSNGVSIWRSRQRKVMPVMT